MDEQELLAAQAALQREFEQASGELMEWITTKARAGFRPGSLFMALSEAADFASGEAEGAEEFWRSMRNGNSVDQATGGQGRAVEQFRRRSAGPLRG